MQTFQKCSRYCQRNALVYTSKRYLSAGPSSSPAPIPWFIDPSDEHPPAHPISPSRLGTTKPSAPLAPIPQSVPPTSIISRLHAALSTSPHLEPGTLLVRDSIPTELGPALPDSAPKGRKKRGRMYGGEGLPEGSGGIWSWVVLAQVKEGTEKRGAIESVVRLVRKTLLTAEAPLPLPPNSKRQIGDGWAMIDAGDFAVHILSKQAREDYFPERRTW